MASNRIPHFWESLRWSIMLRFLSASILTWFIGTQIGVMIEYRQLVTDSPPEKIAFEVEPALPKLASFLETNNSPALNLQMREIADKLKIRQRRVARYFYHNIEQDVFKHKTYAAMVVVNKNGEIVDGYLADFGTAENNDQITLSGDEIKLVNAALRSVNQTQRIDETNTNILAFPLVNQSGEILGAFFLRERVPFVWSEAFTKSFTDFLNDLRDFWLAVAICGFIFGFLQAHQIAQRLDRIALAVKSWSKGEFAARASEKDCDEIGRLSRMLNEMAKSLQAVFSIRQELAMSEERNRIARDLHDSVKQQVFGLVMQIGAARGLLGRDDAAAGQRLSEAEKLANRVQQELVSLIKELRPAEGEKTISLADRLREYIADWSRQHSIAAEVDIENLPPMSYSIENTLFRIAQESLSNIARHSRAARTSVRVARDASNRLSVVFADDGDGFDASGARNGFGLSNIRERAESLPDGSFELTSAVGKGTRLLVGCAIETAAK